MQNTTKPRHEWKYALSRMEYLAIRQRIRTLMQTDPHTGPDGTYRIRSVYFDDPDDHALWEKLAVCVCVRNSGYDGTTRHIVYRTGEKTEGRFTRL